MILKFLAGVRADDMEWVTWLASTEDFDLVLIKLKLYVYSIYRPRLFWSKKSAEMLKAAKEVFSRVFFSKRWVWILILKDYISKISETECSN